MKCMVLKCGECIVTQKYSSKHKGVDLVGYKNGKKCADTVISLDRGKVIAIKTGQKNNKGSTGVASYGNYVQIEYSNGYTSIYAHLKDVYVKLGQTVKKGQALGYMGDTGNAYGVHLHFELRKNKNYNSCINPIYYIENGLSIKKVYYRIYSNTDKRWFNTTSDGKTAGNLKSLIGGIQVRTDNGGSTYYRAHLINGGWLDVVKKWDNNYNGYAGIYGKNIDCITMKSEYGTFMYRVHLKNGDWLPWVYKYGTSKYDEYAGIYGKPIDGLQIKYK